MARIRYSRLEQHGFIEFILGCPLDDKKVIIRVVHDSQPDMVYELATRNSSCNNVFLNSYFLDDGHCNIKLQLLSKACVLDDEVEFECIICNGSSKLADDLREVFRNSDVKALQVGPIDSSYFAHLPNPYASPNYPAESRRNSMACNGKVLDANQIREFDNQGFLVLPSFFNESQVNSVALTLRGVDFNELHGFTRGSSQRIVNLHETYPSLASLYYSAKLYEVVSDLFGVSAYPCQSLTFINGSTQDAHQDTVHLTPFPRGLMCGIWIAIEDVVEGAGELIFYPGSHSLPAVLCSTHKVPKANSDTGDYSEFGSIFTPIIKELLASNNGLESKSFIAKAGDVLIWQENLIHGGAPRTLIDQTRMSMVIHAFGEPALIYYDSLGMSGKRDTSLN